MGWTLQLLAQEFNERSLVVSISKETVRKHLLAVELKPSKENRDRKTKRDWAEEIAQLLEVDYAEAKKVRLVSDNLNTHNITSLYATFPAQKAHRLARRLEMHHTPRNGSWLNIAEIELSVVSGQCLDRRIATAERLKRELRQWQEERNREKVKIKWQFTTADARIKLHHLYPKF